MTIIFDIGKTNKKCFIFDQNFNIVERIEEQLPEVLDDDEFPCDDLIALKGWIFMTMHQLEKKGYDFDKINFSAYGASLVHVNKFGTSHLPLYNYLKPMPDDVLDVLYERYPKDQLALETSSPPLGMLNSGFQLFWLKEKHFDYYMDIVHSLHLPNYLAYLFHDLPVADYTSIGCHTATWDFNSDDYHEWTFTMGISYLLKRPMPATTLFPSLNGRMQVGIGIHDSSAALLPYLVGEKEPFVLISTGTWSIVLNPFNQEPLTINELSQDCLQFLTVNGDKVKASRLFLGQEFSNQIAVINPVFGHTNGAFKQVAFDESLYQKVKKENHKYFKLSSLGEDELRDRNLKDISSFEEAYHQLIWELVQYQAKSLKLALGKTTNIKTIYIDGGFAQNDVFCRMLKHEFPEFVWKKTHLAAGSALGAAIAVNMDAFTEKHFNKILKVEEI